MWQIDGGALVHADKGVCLIDEFTLMRTSEQEYLLEAMEQQHVRIAKAGVISKLNTRCSVIVGMNPKTIGQVDEFGNIPFEHLGIHAALLSRFDIVFASRLAIRLCSSCGGDRSFQHGDIATRFNRTIQSGIAREPRDLP